MTALLTIEKQDYTIKNVKFPYYLVDMTSNDESFIDVKKDLQEVFTEFFHSESFKTNNNTEGFKILHYSLNKLLDDLFMAHNNGRANHIQDKIDKFHNPDKEEPKKEVLN
jgi:hypothetical protein